VNEQVIFDKTGDIARITLNRPEKLNAFNDLMFEGLLDALEAAESDPEVKAIIWAGAGDRAFSTGFDISSEAGREGGSPVGRTPDEARQSMERSVKIALRLWDFPKPIVAAVSGYCLAIAHELVQMCDIVVAANTAQFGEPEVRHHSCPPVLITPYIVGLHKAKELLLTGATVGAEEALTLGFVNKVVPVEKLADEAERFAKRLALVPAVSLKLNKRAVNAVWERMGFRDALAYNAALGGIIHTTDVPEWQRFREIQVSDGFRAFLEARDGPHRALEDDNA
jgi:enoyl-CoA hydratase